ncbi:MHYT domain-containing protein, partial [Paraburkholderia sp.]|uniref:MHYT domain-containing protein n=1 Tax=Paraburkholderia sp. TaxID=1926495 RepID=UPI002D6189FF
MQSSYNFELVAISFIVAALASYTALDLTGRIFLLASARLRHACRLGGAAALGVGIWSMHFVAMLAFSLPIPLGYDFATTAFSLGLAIGVSYLALVMTTHTRLTRLRLVASGVLMGFGIAGMHYTGMAAMQMDPGIHLSAGLVFGLAAGDFMKIDVATFQTVWLITFLCSALITTALSRMFAHVGAFRFWAIGFYLLATATACFALHAIWHTDLLLFATATLALQSRILIWAGTRDLFGASAPWRAGLVVTAVFSLLYGSALAWNAPLLVRASLLALFFAPCRAATLYEVYRRRRPRLGPARMLVAVGSVIATLNAIVPL